MRELEERLNSIPSAPEAAAAAMAISPPAEAPAEYWHRSLETLVVVLAVITIVAALAGMLARLCGGRHLNSRDHDIDGWVERNCSSCLDGGVTVTEDDKPPAAEAKPPPTEGAKK